jgi:hypothetical protein
MARRAVASPTNPVAPYNKKVDDMKLFLITLNFTYLNLH